MKSLQILSIVTWLPTLGAIVILALFKKDQSSLIKKFATAWFAVDFVVSLWLLKYNRGAGGMQFLEDHEWIPIIGARYQMGADGVAVLLIVLTTLLGVIAALSSWNYIQKREKEYYVLLLLLQTSVIGVFSSMDLFLFYLFFEVSLVPMYFLIGIWGGENRLYAAIKFFLYTLVGSVVMLLGVLKMYFLTQDTELTGKITQGTIDLLAGNQAASNLVSSTLQAAAANQTGTFNIVYMQAMGSVMDMGTMQILLFAAFALGFAIKVPMFPFHTWLPDAHVEAPTAGSVILAGILLKLGTYGFFRFNLPMFPGASKDESSWVTSFGTFGVRSVVVFLAIVSIIYGALAAMYFVVKKDGDDGDRLAPASGVYFTIPRAPGSLRIKSNVGGLGSARHHSQRRVLSVALPANVLWKYREPEKRKANRHERTRVGLHDTAAHSFSVDRRLPETVHCFHRKTGECSGQASPAGISDCRFRGGC